MICSILLIVLTRILQGPITDTTPLIINPVIPGGDCLGCTVALGTVTVEPSTVAQWSKPISAIHEPVPIPQNTEAMPTTQGFPLDLEFSMGPRTFDPSDPSGPRTFDPSDPSGLYSILPDSFFAPGAVMRLDKSTAPSLPSSSFATIVPPFTDFSAAAQGFDPTLPITGRKRVVPSGPAQGPSGKRRKLEAHVVDPFMVPMPGPSLEHPRGMSPGAFIGLMTAEVVEEHNMSTLHP